MGRLRVLVERHAGALVVALVVALAIPYAVAGTHFLADDYVWLRNAHFDGWWDAAGPRLTGRPGAWLLTALAFGAIGPHPLPLYLLQTALRAAAAYLVWRCLRELLPHGIAFAVAVVWILMANHLALEMWFSAMPASLALACVAGGALVFIHAVRARERRGPLVGVSCILLAAGVATYELTVGLAFLVVVVLPFVLGTRPRRAEVAGGLVAISVPAAWNLAHASVYGDAVTGRLDPTLVFPGHLSLGLAPFGLQGRLVTAVALVAVAGSVVRLVHRGLRPSTGIEERLTVAGAVLILAGAAPLARFATNFFGLHDRLVLAGGIGAAMVWTGGVLLAGRLLHHPTAVAVAGAVALVAVTVPVRTIRIADYARAGRDAVRATERIAAGLQGQRTVEIRGPIAVVDRVWGLNDGWNTTAAVQRRLDDPRIVVTVVLPDAGRTGPPPDKPRASF